MLMVHSFMTVAMFSSCCYHSLWTMCFLVLLCGVAFRDVDICVEYRYQFVDKLERRL